MSWRVRAMMSELGIGFIGAGTLGKGLALGLSQAGYGVGAVASRTPATAHALAAMLPRCRATEPQGVVDECDVVFITTPDDAISAVAGSLNWSPGRAAVHCSGSGTLDLLLPVARMGARCGSLHPFQTFAGIHSPQDALTRFQGITFAVEAAGWLSEVLEGMARDLGGRAIRLSPESRALYHASAFLSCGLLVGLLRAAAELWREAGLSEEEGLRAVLTLAETTVANVSALGLDGATTGPVVRGDVDTLREHIEELESKAPELVALYVNLAWASLPAAKGRLNWESINRVGELLFPLLQQPAIGAKITGAACEG